MSKFAEIMAELPAIPKSDRNNQQGYAFRGIDSIYNALHPLFAKHGVVCSSKVLNVEKERVESKSGTTGWAFTITMQYIFTSDDHSLSVETVGFSIDYSDKAANQAMAQAHKYALVQAFLIATNEPDPDTFSPEVRPSADRIKALTERVKLLTAGQKQFKEWKDEQQFAWPWDTATCDKIDSYLDDLEKEEIY